MHRRRFIITTMFSGVLMSSLRATEPAIAFDNALNILDDAVTAGQIKAASIIVRHGDQRFERALGTAKLDSAFLLGSITKRWLSQR